jgi:ankyrin repeat protein
MSLLSNQPQSVLPNRQPPIKKKILSDRANLIHNISGKSQVLNEIKLKAIIESLLAAGVSPNTQDSSNWTPAHIAAKGLSPKTIQWMLSLNQELTKRGLETFDFEARGGSHHWTPLHVASYTGCCSVIQDLINKAGCDVFSRSDN